VTGSVAWIGFATPPNQGPAERASIANHTLYEYAPKVLFNFPPKVRLNKYINSNYFVIQEGVVEFTSNLLYLIGFNDVDTDVPILKTVSCLVVTLLCSWLHLWENNGLRVQLQSRQFVSIFLGLLLNVILFVLFALCCILIYSLMTINVQASCVGWCPRLRLVAVAVVCVCASQSVAGCHRSERLNWPYDGWLVTLAACLWACCRSSPSCIPCPHG
jgi:hypothetical protein